MASAETPRDDDDYPGLAFALERTSEPLPAGLSSVDLRTLAAVNGRFTAFQIAEHGFASRDETLLAIQRLLQAGLVRPSRQRTLALGSLTAPAGKATLRSSSSGPARAPGGAPLGMASSLGMDGEPGAAALLEQRPQFNPTPEHDPRGYYPGESDFGQDEEKIPEGVPARFQSVSRPHSTSYSSVPPAALAEEQVSVPKNLRQPRPISESRAFQSLAREANSVNSGGRDTSGGRDGSLADQSGMGRESFRATSGSLDSRDDGRTGQGSAADVSPQVAGRMAISRTHVDEARAETERQAAIGRRASADRFESIDEMGGHEPVALDPLAADWERRPPFDSEPELDPAIVSAAKGQLRDSEMPVPSSRLGAAALRQLDELNDAMSSSREPRLPRLKEDREISAEYAVPGSMPDPSLLPGDHEEESGLPRVGRYEILARLKRGGMGSVYLCRLLGSAGFRRHFAMKVLHSHLTERTEALDAFFHEARVLGGLHHRNIVGIADVGNPTEPYIVLDYVEGGSLAELYRATSQGRDPRFVVTAMLDALDGLTAAHEARDEMGNLLGLVHCDVTPHNLLVGIDGTCRVTDFGIARTGQADVRREITRGKPGYIAPERLERKPTDHRSDLFSLGAVLYMGLTGQEPFSGADAEGTMRSILRDAPQPPSEVGFRPPPALDWLCMKALAKSPEHRFQTAAEMASQLRRIAEREGMIATSAQMGEWVSESLAPTLSARRAAAKRGTVAPGARAFSTAPPPVVDQSPPREAISSAPPPASSQAFNESTEVFDGPTAKQEPSILGRLLILAVVSAVMFVLVWMALKPGSFSRVLGKPDPSGAPSDQTPGSSPEGQTPGASEDDIEIPDIVPAQGAK